MTASQRTSPDPNDSNPPVWHAHRGDVGEILIPRQQIAQRVDHIAGQINDRYGDDSLLIVTVLTGSLVFLADLIRGLTLPVEIDVVSVRSYPGRATQARAMEMTLPITCDLSGRHVLILDDILDSGQTLSALIDLAKGHGAASVRTCVLVRKDRPEVPSRPEPDFVGFDIPDRFVIGYGLDFDGLYRNLPDLRTLNGVEEPGGEEGGP
ncbi:MAG: hypoxanthine phosphoribosyltransferase [Planctomycetota bacterium]|jgi:hypoxanthine phosphoribosyltransferase